VKTTIPASNDLTTGRIGKRGGGGGEEAANPELPLHSMGQALCQSYSYIVLSLYQNKAPQNNKPTFQVAIISPSHFTEGETEALGIT